LPCKCSRNESEVATRLAAETNENVVGEIVGRVPQGPQLFKGISHAPESIELRVEGPQKP
jgi:hypothetical protein